ncbi:MAG: 3-hydroxyacyl-ACP dehydratase FabZ [Alphaproteobacteria bacterium]|jgi:3-hydroxyacyl-[acyl-carrier-protein] dehydratase
MINIEEIMAKIPHRYPFLLIDRVIDIVPDQSATGIKNVTINEPHFTGHFPNKPVMPGVLIIEAMAQTSAVLVCETLKGQADNKLVYFMSIEEAKFRKIVSPGDQLFLHVTKLRSRANVWKFTAEAKVNGAVVAEAIFSAMIADK